MYGYRLVLSCSYPTQQAKYVNLKLINGLIKVKNAAKNAKKSHFRHYCFLGNTCKNAHSRSIVNSGKNSKNTSPELRKGME